MTTALTIVLFIAAVLVAYVAGGRAGTKKGGELVLAYVVQHGYMTLEQVETMIKGAQRDKRDG